MLQLQNKHRLEESMRKRYPIMVHPLSEKEPVAWNKCESGRVVSMKYSHLEEYVRGSTLISFPWNTEVLSILPDMHVRRVEVFYHLGS